MSTTIYTDDVNHEGRMCQVNGETFTLADGSVVAIYRRVKDEKGKEPDSVLSVEELAEDNPAPPLKLYPEDSRFGDANRGIPVAHPKDKSKPIMVKVCVSIEPEVNAMVTYEQFTARLSYRCPHDMTGFACKPCLKEYAL